MTDDELTDQNPHEDDCEYDYSSILDWEDGKWRCRSCGAAVLEDINA